MPFVLRGSKDGFGLPEELRDRDGGRMHAGRFYDTDANKHTSGAGPGFRAYSWVPFDHDGDGDLDLLVGTDHGGIYLCVNEGTAKEPRFATALTELHDTEGDLLAVPGGYQMPFPADWDGDGRTDLVCGSQQGSVYWFRNTGEAGAPRFEPPRVLVDKKAARGLGARTQVSVADYDGDGDLDLLVGDNHMGIKDGKADFHGFVWLFRRAGSPQPQAAQKER
ncbi:MAG TPA: FG-GAP-like repeat-containing protein [Planctomycetota bacterium]|nr:FG-GAP-like repeat-containing protein [Planctomycetota bacterium]